MRAKEFIIEGMTFSPVVEEPYDDPQGKYKTIWTGGPWQRKQLISCRDCDGTGKDWDRECYWCKGTGKSEEYVSDAPELSVSNANGHAIQEMLGLPLEYDGIIKHEDLPKFIRRLIFLKNSSIEDYTEKPTKIQGPLKVSGRLDNVTHINRGPTMFTGGRTNEQVQRYIDQLLDIFTFAQKNNAAVSWV